MHGNFLRRPFLQPLLWLGLAIVLPTLVLLSGCGSASTRTPLNMAPVSQLSSEVQNAPVSVREAYQYAVANPEMLKTVPCYCGCGSAGHTSNYDCYVSEVKPGGEAVLDQHALGCSICVDITQDVMRMAREGKGLKDIRAAIDATYAAYGPSNMPPVE